MVLACHPERRPSGEVEPDEPKTLFPSRPGHGVAQPILNTVATPTMTAASIVVATLALTLA